MGLGMVKHTFSPDTWEAETAEALGSKLAQSTEQVAEEHKKNPALKDKTKQKKINEIKTSQMYNQCLNFETPLHLLLTGKG